MYVLVFARPELGQARPGFGAGRNRSTLTLDPLDAASMDLLVDALVPGMPPAARSKITRQAQGIPLFAVETVRSLIDRDIVQPVEGVYRLTGDVGELAVPDSLHALLAARLDALDPGARRLVADAAVLGTTFPAEALIAVSGRDEPSVRAALADLVRREVLSVSADPLSPERGSYQFAQQMLRQVAYDTLSRRDRKARHLAVAAHLRAAFPGDGEEVTDVIARHYLDALNAIPDDPDAAEIRGQAVTVMTRAAERAERTGAPAQAAASYAAAAELSPPDAADGAAAGLWERAAQAACADASFSAAVEYAEQARGQYLRRGQDRAAARVQAIAGRALRMWGRHAEAREQLTAAVEVLRADPDPDTVWALNGLAVLEVFAGSPDADRLSAEALTLGQALGVGPSQLGELFLTRGLYHARRDAGRRRSPTCARARGSPPRRVTLLCWDARCSTCRTYWPAWIPPPRSTLAGPPSGTCAAPDPVSTWPLRSPTWPRRCFSWVTGTPPKPSSPGRRIPTCTRISSRSAGSGPGWRRCAATPERPRLGSPRCPNARGPAKIPSGSLGSASWRPSPPRPAGDRRTRCAMPARRWLTRTPSGSASSPCAGRGRSPRAARTSWAIPPPSGTCWPCSTPTSPGTWPPCCGPNATWSAPGSPPATATGPPRPPSPPRSRACASCPRPTISPTACSTTPSTWPLPETPGPPVTPGRRGDAGAAASAAAAIAEARDIAGRLRCQPLLDRADALTPRDSATAAPQDSPRVAR